MTTTDTSAVASDRATDPETSSWRHRVGNRVGPSASAVASNRAIRHGDRLVRAALALIDETGNTLFTVQEIAAKANVSLTTLYSCFGGKDALLLATLEEAVREVAGQLAAELETVQDPIERLRAAVVGPLLAPFGLNGRAHALTFVRERERLTARFPQEAFVVAVDPFLNILEAELRAAEHAGIITTTDLTRDAMAIYQLWASHVVMILEGNEADVNATADHLFKFCCRALRFGTPGNPTLSNSLGKKVPSASAGPSASS